jgi:hypothetical protein
MGIVYAHEKQVPSLDLYDQDDVFVVLNIVFYRQSTRFFRFSDNSGVSLSN